MTRDEVLAAVAKRDPLIKADLSKANLTGANLSLADLIGADLSMSNLIGADLHGANLRKANLHGANLHGANLREADLRKANLRGADLSWADLHGADLRGADLSWADLREADLIEAIGLPDPICQPGDIHGWKKLRDGTICELLIPSAARRSNATTRKCRAEWAIVVSGEGVSKHDGTTEYVVGKTVRPHEWCGDRWAECAGGIHFFLTREEAAAW